MKRVFIAQASVLLTLVCFSAETRASVIVQVGSKMDLFDAGDTTPSRDGILPVATELSTHATHIEFTSVTGAMNADLGYWPWNGPDGGDPFAWSGGTNIFTADGISGIIADKYMFMAGVFLGSDGSQEGQEPSRLDFSSAGLGISFEELAPELAQMFFIGDGRSATGSLQSFKIPTGATHLYLGIADATGFGRPGGVDTGRSPGAYYDNLGTFEVELEAVVPEPSTLAIWSLLGVFGTAAGWWRRRKAA